LLVEEKAEIINLINKRKSTNLGMVKGFEDARNSNLLSPTTFGTSGGNFNREGRLSS